MVSPVTFRPAAVLAKNVVTVDDVSGGRVELGIGAGWYEAEHDAYGLPFGTQRSRLDELDRQLAEIHRAVGARRARPGRSRCSSRARRSSSAATRSRARSRPPSASPTSTTRRSPRSRTPAPRRRIVDDAAREAGPRAARLLDHVRLRASAATAARRRSASPAGARSRSSPTASRPSTARSTRSSSACAPTSAAGVERAMLQHLAHEDLESVALLGELVAALS